VGSAQAGASLGHLEDTIIIEQISKLKADIGNTIKVS